MVTTAADVGAAQFVSKFSKPFDLDGLFSLTDSAVLDGDGAEDEAMVEDLPMEAMDANSGPEMMQDDDLYACQNF